MPSEPLSVILIQLDSLNRHFLPCYGNDWIKAPNLTDFARRAATFDRHYTGSLPCMPARREIWAGTEELWWRGWGPLEPWDRPIAYLAGRQGVVSQLVTDHYHFFEWGSHNYNYDFTGYDFIRGHEYDNWRTDPLGPIPDWARVMVERFEDSRIYLRNVQDFDREEDFFAPRVMRATADWLDRNHQQPHFFLQVDCFDVHEPFHVPEPYRSLYTDADYRRYSPWPIYGRVDRGRSALPPDELEWVRAQFAGKLTMVDTWLGHVFDRLERYRLLDRTCVIVTTDHGHYLGDHGWIGKPGAPLYHTLCHIPLLAWYPGGPHNGGRVAATTQTVDLYATVLDLLGVEVPALANIHSRTFAPVLRGETAAHRDHAVYGYANQRVGITSGDWTLLRDHDPAGGAAYWYTQQVEQVRTRSFGARRERLFTSPDLVPGGFLPGVEMPVWRMPTGWSPEPPRDDLLFNNQADPGQQHNVAPDNPDVIRRLEVQLRDHALALGAPEEQLGRLRLR